MTDFKTGHAPHIRSSRTTGKIFWTLSLAFLPLLLLIPFFSGWDGIRIVGSSLAGGILAEVTASRLFRRPVRLEDGSTVFLSLSFALMCSAHLPSWMAGLGAFFAIFAGKEIFGGTGAYLFHPAVAGQAFLHISFPFAMAFFVGGESGRPYTWPDFFLSGTPSWLGLAGTSTPFWIAEISPLALLAGGLFLIARKVIDWETPVLFLVSVSVLSFLGQEISLPAVFSGTLLFTAFFLITEPVSSPIPRRGRQAYAFLAAVFIVFFRHWLAYFYVIPFALLSLNALTPWINMAFQPLKKAEPV